MHLASPLGTPSFQRVSLSIIGSGLSQQQAEQPAEPLVAAELEVHMPGLGCRERCQNHPRSPALGPEMPHAGVCLVGFGSTRGRTLLTLAMQSLWEVSEFGLDKEAKALWDRLARDMTEGKAAK